MKKAKSFKVCHICNGRGEKGCYYLGEFLKKGRCHKCNGTGYLK